MIHYILSLNSNLTPAYLALFLFLAMVMGMTKAGLTGLSLSVIPVMALIFGAKESTGVVLPILIAADIMAVIYYHKNAVWKHILNILPWVAAGIVIALFTGNMISNSQFRVVMISIVWVMLILMVINDLRKKEESHVPESWLFGAFMGLAGGFATMMGNSAGPVFALYFLSRKLPKKEFIGTGAWLYLIMNVGKLPLQAMVWKNISMNSIILDLIAVPFIALGIVAGIYIVKLFPEKAYRYFVIITTIASSILLLI